MSELLFTILVYDGKVLSEEIRIYSPVKTGFQLSRLEILHGVVRSSSARSSSEKLENVSRTSKKRPLKEQRRQNYQRKQKEIAKA